MEINIRKDKMTSEERIRAILNKQPVDRIPFYSLFSVGFCALNAGYTIADAYNNMPKAFDAQARIFEQYNWDKLTSAGYAAFGPWEFGGEIKWPSGEFAQCPMPERIPVTTEEDVSNLKMPDVKTAGFLPLFIEFAELEEKAGRWYSYAIGHPFTAAGNLCGAEQFCRWMMKKPELVRHLLRMMTDHLVEMTQYLRDRFGTERFIPWFGDPTAANQMISPKNFEQFALPYIKELHEKVLAMGYKHILCHICGEQNENYPYWAQAPMGKPGIISVSQEVDLEKAIEYFPNDIIVGNIEPAILQTGTPQEVYELSRKIIEKGRKAPVGFMLAPGCELPPMSPPENMWAMMQAVSDFGWYDQ